MDTPWGELAQLKIGDHNVAEKILLADKHTLIEGLVAECIFDQITGALPQTTESRISILDVETVVVDTRRSQNRWIVFVWARNKQPGLGRFLLALEKKFAPYLVRIESGQFQAARASGGRITSEYEPLDTLMRKLSGRNPQRFMVDEAVRDADRQKRAFWGFISDYYKEQLWDRVVLPRLLINCGIQPYFRAVWNVDRVIIYDDNIWLAEIKHKFPIDRKGLYFGINDGELSILGHMAEAGIRSLHTVIVKPVWSKDVGSMYLLNDFGLRAKAALIAKVLDGNTIDAVAQKQSATSGIRTSITGASVLKYKTLPATDFKRLGVISDNTAELARRMSEAMMGGGENDCVEDNWLRKLRDQ